MLTVSPARQDEVSPQRVGAAPRDSVRVHNRAIQGLRAVAVLAVVADHLVKKPAGGFVGVDIFFVISGYLITVLLLREVTRSGRLDLLDFYRRRIKRTVPLAVVVIALSVAVGAAVFPYYRLGQLQDAAFGAGTFSINWQLIGLGTDYLHATDLPTPLQHFWSLAVEEQFYLFWPLALIVATMIARRAGFGARIAVIVLTSTLTVTSLVFCFWQTANQPTAAYFSTFSRAWELAVGALLAAGLPVLARVPRAWCPVLAWAGIAGIAVSLLRITPESSFPAPWAALPVVSTALVIAASERGGDARLAPLTNRTSQSIGDLSYSLYLWHYPVVVFGAALLGTSRPAYVVQAVLIVALSILSYRLLETPLRRASWRSTFRSSFRAAPRIRRPAPVVLLSALALIVSVAAFPALTAPPAAASAELPGDAAFHAVFTTQGDTSEIRNRRAVVDAAATSSWPQGVKDDVAAGVQHLPAVWTRQGCLWMQHDTEAASAKAQRCEFGASKATRTAVLFGDSIALSYYPALRSALDPAIWRIRVMTAEQCPAWRMAVLRDDGSPYPECDRFRADALAAIGRLHPDLVVTASSYSALWRAAPSSHESGKEAWRSGAAATLSALARETERVLVLDAPQMGPSLRDCLTPTATPLACAGVIDQNYADAWAGEVDSMRQIRAATITHPETVTWYCTSRGVCPPVVNGNQTLADGMHPSESDARRIGRLVSDALDHAAGRERLAD